MARPLAVDWDDTLVDAQTQEWLPGARTAIIQLRIRGYEPFIHTCRANWPEGLASIEAKLAAERLSIRVEAKPYADFYIDDKAVPILDGDWQAVLRSVPPTAQAMRLASVGR